MSALKIDRYIIDTPIIDILTKVRNDINNGKLKDIQIKGDNIRVTCPNNDHKNGKENKPSCDIYCGDSDKLEYGWTNCFTCHDSGPLWHFIGECFDKDDQFGREWLIDNFGSQLVQQNLFKSNISVIKKKKEFLDERVLDNFQSYHPYMIERKLTPAVIERFKIRYDPISKSLVFPVWDKCDRLVFLTRRSVENKRFLIPEDVDKPVYLLNFVLKENTNKVYVAESQINTLTLQGWGYPAIGLFGTGSSNQYSILNKSGIRVYYLCLDGDDAGDKGIERFKKNISKSSIIKVVKIPRGKDLNDLTKEEFENLPVI